MENFDIINNSWVVNEPISCNETRTLILSILEQAGCKVPRNIIEHGQAEEYPYLFYPEGGSVNGAKGVNQLITRRKYTALTLKELLKAAEQIINSKT